MNCAWRLARTTMMSKPVVATSCSGSAEFMPLDNSLLMDFEPQRLGQRILSHEADFHWAKPGEGHAAELTRRLHDDPTLGRQIEETATADARVRLSVCTAGQRVVRRLIWSLAGRALNGGAS